MFSTLWPHATYFLKDFSSYLILIAVTLVISVISAYKIYRMKIDQKRKRILVAALSTVFIFIFIFSLCESYFRYVYDEPDGLGFLKVSKKWTERHVIYNNYFYRDRDFDQAKKERITRIGVLGDSITWGGGVENPSDRFSNILEKKLNDAGYKVEVYNLGRPGYDTQQEIAEFEKVRNLNFDLIIWEYFLNDIQPNIKSTGTRIIETNRDLPPYITFFTNKSYFLDYLYWRLTPKHRKTFRELKAADIAQYSNQEILKKHEERIANFIKSFEGTNTKILVVIFPSLLLLGQDYPAAHIHHLMTEIFRQDNLEVIDLLADFRNMNKKELMASNFDPHPNELAHQLVAQKLFDYLKSQIN